MIPDDVVEEVRAAADIVDVIGEFVPLKKAGREFKANCPFHEERTPSFFVVPAKAMYHCFGCGEHGDVFTFVRKRLGLDFVEAVKHVAQRTGIPVREIRSGRSDDPLRPLREAMAFARDFFLDRLWSWKGGEPARRYLEARGIRRETAERFGLGFSPPEWRALREAAGKHGLEDELLEEVGLLVRGEKRDAPYDRFRGRLMFPIEDVAGRVVAFGGRVMPGVTAGGGKGKYVNSPETPLYHKGRILYGLSWAKNAIRREQSVLVVEGYMDVVSVASAGVENVVAASGTSLTEEQAELLKRYSKQVYLLFDSDRAGLRATFRAGDTLLAEGLHPSVVTLPPSEDPDSVVREQGAEGLRAYVGDAVDILDRKLQILEEHDYFSSIERTRNAVDRLLPTVRAARDPTLRDIYVAKVADKTRVRRETLEAELLREVATRRSPHPGPTPRSRDRSSYRLPKMGAERTVLLLLIRRREWVERAAEHVGPEDFHDGSYRAIFEAMVHDPELTRPPEAMDSAAARRLEGLLSDPEELSHAERVFQDSIHRLKHGSREDAVRELERRLEGAESFEEKQRLLKEMQDLRASTRDERDWLPTLRQALERKRSPTADSP
jgi:DNA primase